MFNFIRKSIFIGAVAIASSTVYADTDARFHLMASTPRIEIGQSSSSIQGLKRSYEYPNCEGTLMVKFQSKEKVFIKFKTNPLNEKEPKVDFLLEFDSSGCKLTQNSPGWKNTSCKVTHEAGIDYTLFLVINNN